MLARFFFTGHSIYEFTALTKITVEDEGPSWFSGSGLVVVFRPNFSSSSSFHLTVFSIFLLSPLIPDTCHFWYATTFERQKVHQLSHRSHLLLQVQMVAHRLSDHTFSVQYLPSLLRVLRHCCRFLPEAVQIIENCSL